MRTDFPSRLFAVTKDDFARLAIEVFHFQYQHNTLYKAYVDTLGVLPQQVSTPRQIPFLPIDFFKNFQVMTGSFTPEIVFESSGTTQTIPSLHLVKDLSIYKMSFLNGFELFYGPIKEWCIIGLLPSYLERKGSSLVFMADELIRLSQHPLSGFYLNDFESLSGNLAQLEADGQKTMLIGVSFALLDFASQFPMRLKHVLIMETGGMKGKHREMTRGELHATLKEQFGLSRIHSEYGMTELLSQAYSIGDGIFTPAPWMRILLRKEDDPMDVNEEGEGIINIIDLANIYSCAFIASEDVGKLAKDGSFEIAGRVDHADLRGCSLLVF
ncbi:MAG: acyl transferase [Chitinophagales bacterium]